MKRIILSETQGKELARILREEVYSEPGPQSPDFKKASKPYCVNPEKVLIVKKFLDKTFTQHNYEKIGDDGMPTKIKIVSMNASNGEPLKYMYKSQLHDLLVDKFQKMFSDVAERSLFMSQVMKDWFNGKIGLHGNLSVNRLMESVSSDEIDSKANEAAKNPSEAQMEAGNYKMGHISIKGMPISIETPKGSVRKFKNENGTEGSITLKNHYGYFKHTSGNGKDGDAVDVFIGPNIENFTKVYVIDQDVNREFDESKVMLGFSSVEEAKEAYMSNYSEGWDGFREITAVSIDVFKKWLYRDHKQRKPFSTYVAIQKHKLNESIIAEEEYNEIKTIAIMPSRSMALMFAKELEDYEIDAYADDNEVKISVERDNLDDYYVDNVVKFAREKAYEFVTSKHSLAQSMVNEALDKLDMLDVYDSVKRNTPNNLQHMSFDGYEIVGEHGHMNIKDEETGELVSDEWFDWCGYMVYGYAIVRKHHKYNLLKYNGEIVFDEWHDDIVESDDHYSFTIIDCNEDGEQSKEIVYIEDL